MIKLRLAWFILLCTLAFSSCSYLPEPPVESGDVRMEENRDYLLVEPFDTSGMSQTGLVFYPGGLVDPHAYLAMAVDYTLSGRGHRVIIVKMPSNLAVLDIKAAGKILKDQDMEEWVISGHSLGGAMACSMVEKEQDIFGGLVLLAAYPAGSVDLSAWEQPVLSISATEDLVVDPVKFEDGKSRLPPTTSYEAIEGGNHAGFGRYGEQKGDGLAGITGADQQRQVVELIQNFFLDYGLD